MLPCGRPDCQHVTTDPHSLRYFAVYLVPEDRFRKGQAQTTHAVAQAGEDIFMGRRAACGDIQRVRPRMAW